MKKISKKLTLILIAVLCLTLCVVSLVACSKKPTHTVTVLMPDDSAAVGVDVTIKKGTATLGTVKTGNDGKAKFILEDDDYTVELASFPAHYGVADDADLSMSNDKHALTVKLVEDFHYTIIMTNADTDEPFYAEGLLVQLCTVVNGETGNCLSPVLVGTDGIAKIYQDDDEPTVYHAKVVSDLPEGYEYVDNFENGYHVKELSAEDSEVTIYVKHVVNETYNDIQVTAQLSPYADQNYGLVGVPMDGSAVLVYNETDKYYHLGTANGPVIVVNLTQENDMERYFSKGAFVYLEMGGMDKSAYVYDVTPDDAPAYTKVYDDYRLLLRGFKDYEFTPGMSIPSNITEEKYYTANVNSDGVYPLNQELKEFLEVFYNNNKDTVDFNTEDAPAGWLFPCYYYDVNVQKEVVVGNYKVQMINEGGTAYNVGDEYDGGTLTEDTFKLTVTANAYIIEQYRPFFQNYGEYESGNVSKNENGTYTFGFEDFMGTLEYVVTYNAADQTLTFTLDDETMYIFKKA